MVAEKEATIADNPKRKGRNHSIPPISLLSKAKARNLYMVQGLDWKCISEQVGVSVLRLQQLASREGWTAHRKQLQAKMLARTEQRIAAQLDEVSEAIASESEEIALSGLQNARESLARCDKMAAKDFQAYTSGVRNMAQVARLMREPQGSTLATTSAPSVNLFFFGGNVASKADAKNVTPSNVAGVMQSENAGAGTQIIPV